MTDTHMIPGTEIPMITKKIAFYKATPQRVLKWRKMFLLLSILFTIALCVDLYISGIELGAAIDALAALTMFNFSTKCETLYLKLRLEESLEQKGVTV